MKNFSDNSNTWKLQHISNVAIDKVEKELDEYIQLALIGKNDLEGTNVPSTLYNSATNYMDLIPALRVFQNPNVQEEKFRQMITKLLKQDSDFILNPRSSLEILLNLEVGSIIDKLK